MAEAKGYTTKNGKEIVGWIYKNGRRIPITKRSDDRLTVKGKSFEEARARMSATKREERKEALQKKYEDNRKKSIRELENQEGKDSFGYDDSTAQFFDDMKSDGYPADVVASFEVSARNGASVQELRDMLADYDYRQLQRFKGRKGKNGGKNGK